METTSTTSTTTEYSFVQRVSIAVSITLLAILLLWLLGSAFNVLLLVLAAVLIALPLRAGATWLHRRTGWPEGVALVLFVLVVVGVLTGIVWLVVTRVGDQFGQLQQQLPEALRSLQQRLAHTGWGQRLAAQDLDYEKMLKGGSGWLSRVTGVLSSTVSLLADAYIVLFLALFLVIQPGLYRSGILLLIPPAGRPRGGQVLAKLNQTLVKWLLGQLFSMTVVGILSSLGLWALGVPLAGALGLFAGLITFIPNLGPVLSMVPAVLLALLHSPQQALYVVALYLGIQLIESNLLTPLVQKKLIAMPPALILVAQLVLGLYAGTLGLVLATPIMAIILVLVKMLYVQDVLNDQSVEV